jgi:hypothetical protein
MRRRTTLTHFVQTAEKNGVPKSVVQEVFNELLQIADSAVSKTLDGLPGDFPEALAGSIVRGLRSRLRWVESASAAPTVAAASSSRA